MFLPSRNAGTYLSRILKIFHFRVSLSPLRCHKSRHNFIDTPSDICLCNQGVEDTSHFLFSCPSFVTQRATLVTSVNEILLKYNLIHLGNQQQLYLYGPWPTINIRPHIMYFRRLVFSYTE